MDTLANAAAELADIVDDVSGPQDEEDDASMSYSEPEDNLPPGYYKETSNAQQGDAPFSMPGHSCGAYKAMQSHVEVRGKRVNVKRRGKHGPVTRRPVQVTSNKHARFGSVYRDSSQWLGPCKHIFMCFKGKGRQDTHAQHKHAAPCSQHGICSKRFAQHM